MSMPTLVRGSGLQGKRVGLLVIIKPTGEGKRGKTEWACQCDCGRLTTASADSLRKGRPSSCGCAPNPNFKDISGMRFGSLVAVELAGKSRWGELQWLCRCDCGNSRVCISGRLKQKQVTHCGCKAKEKVEIRAAKSRTHGLTKTRLYTAWNSMVNRCESPNNASYNTHGAMGVKVCPEWRNNKRKFFEWALSNGYRDDLTLDRFPDSFGDYSPDNCRWATAKQQQRNRRDNRLVEWNGERKTVAEWSEVTGLKSSTIESRIHMGWTPDDTFTLPPDKQRRTRRRSDAYPGFAA